MKIGVIGGGIAGLSAGIYARLQGFEVDVFEKNAVPGGVCASWNRNGYQVNSSVHWVLGSAPGSDMHKLWQELGVAQALSFVNHPCFAVYEGLHEHAVHLYANAEMLRAELKRISPQDQEPIDELCDAIVKMAEMEPPMDKPLELMSLWEKADFVLLDWGFLQQMMHWTPITMQKFADRFHSKTLSEVFLRFWDPRMSMSFFLINMAYAHKGSAGYPIGGSAAFVEALSHQLKSLGGRLHLSQGVSKILVEDDRVSGLQLMDGRRELFDAVIACVDGHHTLFELLPEGRVPASMKDAFNRFPLFPPLLLFSAGFRYPFHQVEAASLGTSLSLSTPLVCGARRHTHLFYQFHTFDPRLAPEGCTLVTAMVETDFDFWKALRQTDRHAYEEVKQHLIQRLIRELDLRFPGVEDTLEFADLATPLTYARGTGNFQGSYEGWLPTPAALMHRFPSQIRGLADFQMAGHWVTAGGGMPPTALSAKHAVQRIVHAKELPWKPIEIHS